MKPLRLLPTALLIACAGAPAPRPPDPPEARPPPAAAGDWRPTPPPGPLAAARTAAPPARTELLPNGLRVVVVEQPGRPLVLASLVLPRGTLTDPDSALGATGLALELLGDFREMAEGGEELLEEKSVRRQAMEKGGAISFSAAADSARISVAGYAGEVSAYLKLIADAVIRPRHGKASYRERRDALLDDLEDRESWEPEALEAALAGAAFGGGHPYARSERGSHASLSALGLEDVVQQQRRIVVPEGATLLVVGEVLAERVLAEVRTAFGRWQGRAVPQPAVPRPGARAGGLQLGLLLRRPASTFTVCAARPISDPRHGEAGVEVLAALLGQGTGSRLMRALRDEAGLSYGASAVVVRRRQARALLVCAPVEARRAAEGLALFRQVLEAVRTGPPGEAELARAKALCLAERDAAWDGPVRTARTWLEAIALGSGLPRVAEEQAALERVTGAEVARLARELLDPGSLRWIVSGDPAVAARAAGANRMGAPYRIQTDR